MPPESKPGLEHPEEQSAQAQPTIEELQQRLAEANRLLDEQLELSKNALNKTSPEGLAIPDAVAIHDDAKPDFGEEEPVITPESAVMDLSAVVSGNPDDVKKVLNKSQVNTSLEAKLADPNFTPGDAEHEDPYEVASKFFGRSPDR